MEIPVDIGLTALGVQLLGFMSPRLSAWPAFLAALMATAVPPSICKAQSYLITTVAGGAVPFTPAQARSVPLGPVSSVAAGAHVDVYIATPGYVFQMNAAGILTRVAGTSS